MQIQLRPKLSGNINEFQDNNSQFVLQGGTDHSPSSTGDQTVAQKHIGSEKNMNLETDTRKKHARMVTHETEMTYYVTVTNGSLNISKKT